MITSSIAARARNLTDRLRNAPAELIKTELDALLGALHSNERARLILTGLLERERPHIGENAGAFIRGTPGKHQLSLEFANSPERRAAFGYQVLTGMLLGSKMSNDELLQVVINDGAHYALGSTLISDMIAAFVDVFIEPIIDYLEYSQSSDDLILALMAKYKHRCEWFDTERLRQIAWGDENAKYTTSQVEQRLKHDFCRYLFDYGLDFVMEAESPKQKGATDILTPKLISGQRLVVEAKVFDGKNRDKSWLRDGIGQAASYTEEWGEDCGYLLVYNLAVNCLLEFEGANRLWNLWVIHSHGKEIRLVDVNLSNDLAASKTSQLVIHKI